MKSCSKSLLIGEMRIETLIIYILPSGWFQSKEVILSVGKDVEWLEFLYVIGI